MPISMEEVNQKVDNLGSAWEAFKSANDARLKEVEKKGAADPLYKEQIEKVNTALDEQKAALDAAQAEIDGFKAFAARSQLNGNGGEHVADTPEMKAYNAGFVDYLRGGMEESELKSLGKKALSVGSDPDGGYLVTPAMSSRIVTVINETSPLRALASVETISTDSLEFLEDVNQASSGWTSETGTVSDTNTPQVGKRNIPVHEMYAQPKATQKLLDDAKINVEQWLSGKVAESFALKEATAFISGNGVGQPRGILTYDAGTSWGQVEQVVSGSAAAVTADGLIALVYALKEHYQSGASFLMRRATVKTVRQLKESTTNAYIWQPGLKGGQPDSLLGYSAFQAADMPAEAANALSVAFGNWKAAYGIVDRLGIRVLRDPYTEKPFVKFYTTKRVGGDVINFEAFKIGKCST